MENKLTGALLLGLAKSRNYLLLVLLERGGGGGLDLPENQVYFPLAYYCLEDRKLQRANVVFA